MITRFTAYRRNLSGRGTHIPGVQANPDDQPQYEGVVFSDGTCVLKWLTAAKSVSIFGTLAEMLSIHGHPEYGTDIEWHDTEMPEEWKHQLMAHAEHRQAEFHEAGKLSVTLLTETDDAGNLLSIVLKEPGGDVIDTIYPVTP